MLKRPSPEFLDKFCGIVPSTRGRPHLDRWAAEFIEAHIRTPGGLTIEVGTHIGGSAYLFAVISEEMYGAGNEPPLWTVDPYGAKPYVGGDVNDAPIYGDLEYLAMKWNLHMVPFHTHWLMESSRFFMRMTDLPYWRPGARTYNAIDSRTGQPLPLRVGEKHRAGEDSATFILLDGEHAADSILRDLDAALPWLRAAGTIVIDNVNTDPATMPRLTQEYGQACDLKLDQSGEWLVVRKQETK